MSPNDPREFASKVGSVWGHESSTSNTSRGVREAAFGRAFRDRVRRKMKVRSEEKRRDRIRRLTVPTGSKNGGSRVCTPKIPFLLLVYIEKDATPCSFSHPPHSCR